jgi:hypothetical protein
VTQSGLRPPHESNCGYWVHGRCYYFYSVAHLSSQVDKGVRAVAKVDRLSEGFCLLGTKKTTYVNLTLTVHLKGRRPFRSSLTRSLSERWLSRVQPGSWVVVAIHKADPTVVYINEAALEEPPPSPPPYLPTRIKRDFSGQRVRCEPNARSPDGMTKAGFA